MESGKRGGGGKGRFDGEGSSLIAVGMGRCHARGGGGVFQTPVLL